MLNWKPYVICLTFTSNSKDIKVKTLEKKKYKPMEIFVLKIVH